MRRASGVQHCNTRPRRDCVGSDKSGTIRETVDSVHSYDSDRLLAGIALVYRCACGRCLSRRAAARKTTAHACRDGNGDAQSRPGAGRKPDRNHLQVRRRARRHVRAGLPRDGARRGHRRRADVDRRSPAADPPTTQWKPGQTIEYTRTIFVPIFPYVGDATIQLGLYSTADQKRLPLAGDDVGQHAYKVAQLQLAPQTDNLFTVFKDGWHPAETADKNAAVDWQWTKKEATLAFKNPRKDAVLYLDVDSPGAKPPRRPAGDGHDRRPDGRSVLAHTRQRSRAPQGEAAGGADGRGRDVRAADRRRQDVRADRGQQRRKQGSARAGRPRLPRVRRSRDEIRAQASAYSC